VVIRHQPPPWPGQRDFACAVDPRKPRPHSDGRPRSRRWCRHPASTGMTAQRRDSSWPWPVASTTRRPDAAAPVGPTRGSVACPGGACANGSGRAPWQQGPHWFYRVFDSPARPPRRTDAQEEARFASRADSGTRACLRSCAALRPDSGWMSRTEVLTDEMWARIEPLLPALKGAMGKPMSPHRPLVEGSIF